MAIYNMGLIYPVSAFVRVHLFTNIQFLSITFGSRYAWKPIKDSEDSDDNLDSKKTWAKKMAHCFGANAQVKLAKKTQNTPTCDVTRRETQIRNENNFAFNLNYETCWIRRLCEKLSSLIGWWVIALQSLV